MTVAASPLNRAYLDYNATAPLRLEARKAALVAMETTGNPSSVHAEGRAARRIVEDARSEVARLAGVASRCVTFVSGGTEGANAALNPLFGGGSRALRSRRSDRPRLARGRLPPSGTGAARVAGRQQRDRRHPAGRR